MKNLVVESTATPDPGPYEACSICQFYRNGQCRRLPPTVWQLAVMRQPDRDIAPAIWPQVEPGDWCGEWQATIALSAPNDE